MTFSLVFDEGNSMQLTYWVNSSVLQRMSFISVDVCFVVQIRSSLKCIFKTFYIVVSGYASYHRMVGQNLETSSLNLLNSKNLEKSLEYSRILRPIVWKPENMQFGEIS